MTPSSIRRLLLAALLGALASPAAAQVDYPNGFVEMAGAYCNSLKLGDMTFVQPLLTDELRGLLTGKAVDQIPWLGDPSLPLPVACMAVGNSGTRDRPETIVSVGFAKEHGTLGVVLVMVWDADNRLHIDDIRFPDQTTFRQKLAAMP